MRKVRCNGFEGSFIYSDSPLNLEPGKIYEVVCENDYGWQKNYHLKGVDGEYNSKWFTVISTPKEEVSNLSPDVT
jgi:hypothetical protein